MLKGRQPTSQIVTNYNEGVWGDSEPWGGVTIGYTQWNGRTPIQINYLLNIGDGNYLTIDDTNFLLVEDITYGTTLTGRPIPN